MDKSKGEPVISVKTKSKERVNDSSVFENSAELRKHRRNSDQIARL